MGSALESGEAVGCTLVPVHMPPPAEVVKIHGIILLSEAAAYYEQAKLADHPGLPALPRANIDAARGFSAIQYAQATQTRRLMRDSVSAIVENEAELLIVPTLPVITPLHPHPTAPTPGNLQNTN